MSEQERSDGPEEETAPATKPQFYQVCEMYDQQLDTLRNIANKEEKAWYTIDEALVYLDISVHVLSRTLIAYDIETRKLLGSDYQYIAACDVRIIEQSLKAPTSVA